MSCLSLSGLLAITDVRLDGIGIDGLCLFCIACASACCTASCRTSTPEKQTKNTQFFFVCSIRNRRKLFRTTYLHNEQVIQLLKCLHLNKFLSHVL